MYMKRQKSTSVILYILVSVMLICLTACSGDKASDSRTTTEEAISEAETLTRDIHKLSDVKSISDNKYSCSYDGVSHEFILFLPNETTDAPLVLMLHGYGESAERFRDYSHFEQSAVPEGYAVCYITGAANPNDATSSNGWNSGIAADGNDDLSFLISLSDYLREEYGLNKDKLFAIGFSNGAFMIHRLAVEAGDVFTGLISVAGKMPESIWAEREAGFCTSFFQVTGEKDDVVPMNSSGTSKYAKDPAIEDVIDYWVQKAGLSKTDESEVGNRSVLTKYGADSEKISIWNLWIKDARHSWPDESVNKININEYIIEFLNGLR